MIRQLALPGRYGEVVAELKQTYAQWLEDARQGNFTRVYQAYHGRSDFNLRGGSRNISAEEKQIRDAAGKMLTKAREALNPEKGRLGQLLALPEERLIRDVGQILPRIELLLELVQQFGERYTQEKREANAVDFADLEHITLGLLLEKRDNGRMVPSELARRLHERYAHVLVDEYQDINPVQDEILKLISHECVHADEGAAGNLFCVGDVKQSIYRFRLADSSIFQNRQRDYSEANGKDGMAIHLQDNFRSRKPLLDAINSLFTRLMREKTAEIEYDQTQAFTAGFTYPPAAAAFTGAPVALHVVLTDEMENPAPVEGYAPPMEEQDEMEDTEREARHVGKIIGDLLSPAKGPRRQVYDRQTKGYRELRYGDCAILMRSMKQRTREYARIFAELGIPLRAESRSGFFTATEVQDVLSLLRVLDNSCQDIYLAAVLRSPLGKLSRAEDSLLQIHGAYRGIPFHEAVSRYAREKKDLLAGQLQALRQRLEQWRMLAMQRPVAELLATIYRETNLPEWYLGLPNGEQRLANLEYLQQCAEQFAQFQRQGLYRFVQYLEDLEDKDSLAQPPAETDVNSVRLMSVHASKGLEFPVVIVAGLGRKMDQRDIHDSLLLDRRNCVALRAMDVPSNTRYPSLATHVMENRISQATRAEELRILYVALTRAREHLVLVGTAKEKQLEQWKKNTPAQGQGLAAMAFNRGGCFLDWVAPLFQGETENLLEFKVIASAPAAVEATPVRAVAPTEVQPARNIAALSPTVLGVIERMQYQYPQQALTQTAAAVSVTSLSKQAKPAALDADSEEIPAAAMNFQTPAFAQQAATDGANAAARGTATHLALQFLDFSLPTEKLEEQIARLSGKGRLSVAQQKLVDIQGLHWFWESELGQLMRQNHTTMQREIPFLDAVAESPAMGLDRQMLRGRIDAIVPTEKGLLIVDYKTDRTLPEPHSEREQAYRKQVALYRHALERSGMGPVAGVALVFLSVREIWQT